jgi:hypothetical protein
MDSKKLKVGPLDFKEKRGSSRRSLKETPQQGPGSSGKPHSGPAATSVPAGGTSAERRDKPMAGHLPEVKTKITLMEVSLTDTPLQGASTSSKIVEKEGQGRLVPQTGELRLAKEALSGYTRRKLRKTKAGTSEASTGGFQQPGNASGLKPGETSTKPSKRPRSEGSTPTEVARESKGPGTIRDQGPIQRL